MSTELRPCTKCKVPKLPHEFYQQRITPKTRKDGKTSRCIECLGKIRKTSVYREDMRARQIMRRYGMSLDLYDSLLSKGCEICGTKSKRMVMDHCHSTGSVRGALCVSCNSGLGAANDDVKILRKMIEYLEEERHISQGIIGSTHGLVKHSV